MNIGSKIKEIRIEKALKQTELAKKAKISNSYLCDIENSRTEPSLKTLLKIANALDTKDINIFLSNSYVKTEHSA